jgi:hypothetical protein
MFDALPVFFARLPSLKRVLFPGAKNDEEGEFFSLLDPLEDFHRHDIFLTLPTMDSPDCIRSYLPE